VSVSSTQELTVDTVVLREPTYTPEGHACVGTVLAGCLVARVAVPVEFVGGMIAFLQDGPVRLALIARHEPPGVRATLVGVAGGDTGIALGELLRREADYVAHGQLYGEACSMLEAVLLGEVTRPDPPQPPPTTQEPLP
jgi:hypothetical protein